MKQGNDKYWIIMKQVMEQRWQATNERLGDKIFIKFLQSIQRESLTKSVY